MQLQSRIDNCVIRFLAQHQHFLVKPVHHLIQHLSKIPSMQVSEAKSQNIIHFPVNTKFRQIIAEREK